MAAGRVVEAFDELKDGDPRLAVRSEATSIDQLAFEGGEETLAHGIVVSVAEGACRSTHAGFLAAIAESDRRVLRAAIRMMDDVVGLSGRERHVESVEHDAGLQIGREGPSDDPARPGVENHRGVKKAGQRRQEGDVGHPQLIGLLGHEVAADEIAGGMMVCRLPRRDRPASAPADALDPCRPRQPSNLLPANREAIGLQLCVNTRRAIGSMRSGVDRADMTRQIGVSGRPCRSWSAPPGAIARGRNLHDAGHCANGIHGLVRAHEPANPFGLALLSRANQAAAFARMSRS